MTTNIRRQFPMFMLGEWSQTEHRNKLPDKTSWKLLNVKIDDFGNITQRNGHIQYGTIDFIDKKFSNIIFRKDKITDNPFLYLHESNSANIIKLLDTNNYSILTGFNKKTMSTQTDDFLTAVDKMYLFNVYDHIFVYVEGIGLWKIDNNDIISLVGFPPTMPAPTVNNPPTEINGLSDALLISPNQRASAFDMRWFSNYPNYLFATSSINIDPKFRAALLYRNNNFPLTDNEKLRNFTDIYSQTTANRSTRTEGTTKTNSVYRYNISGQNITIESTVITPQEAGLSLPEGSIVVDSSGNIWRVPCVNALVLIYQNGLMYNWYLINQYRKISQGDSGVFINGAMEDLQDDSDIQIMGFRTAEKPTYGYDSGEYYVVAPSYFQIENGYESGGGNGNWDVPTTANGHKLWSPYIIPISYYDIRDFLSINGYSQWYNDQRRMALVKYTAGLPSIVSIPISQVGNHPEYPEIYWERQIQCKNQFFQPPGCNYAFMLFYRERMTYPPPAYGMGIGGNGQPPSGKFLDKELCVGCLDLSGTNPNWIYTKVIDKRTVLIRNPNNYDPTYIGLYDGGGVRKNNTPSYAICGTNFGIPAYAFSAEWVWNDLVEGSYPAIGLILKTGLAEAFEYKIFGATENHMYQNLDIPGSTLRNNLLFITKDNVSILHSNLNQLTGNNPVHDPVTYGHKSIRYKYYSGVPLYSGDARETITFSNYIHECDLDYFNHYYDGSIGEEAFTNLHKKNEGIRELKWMQTVRTGTEIAPCKWNSTRKAFKAVLSPDFTSAVFSEITALDTNSYPQFLSTPIVNVFDGAKTIQWFMRRRSDNIFEMYKKVDPETNFINIYIQYLDDMGNTSNCSEALKILLPPPEQLNSDLYLEIQRPASYPANATQWSLFRSKTGNEVPYLYIGNEMNPSSTFSISTETVTMILNVKNGVIIDDDIDTSHEGEFNRQGAFYETPLSHKSAYYWDNRVYIGCKGKIKYSEINDVQNFPILNYKTVDAEDEIIAFMSSENILYAFSSENIYAMAGDPSSSSFEKINKGNGTIDSSSVIAIGRDIYFMSSDGYAKIKGYNYEIIGEAVKDAMISMFNSSTDSCWKVFDGRYLQIGKGNQWFEYDTVLSRWTSRNMSKNISIAYAIQPNNEPFNSQSNNEKIVKFVNDDTSSVIWEENKDSLLDGSETIEMQIGIPTLSKEELDTFLVKDVKRMNLKVIVK